MSFFGSGRYREQLKLLYKAHKVFLPQCILLEHRDTEPLSFFGCGRYREQLKLLDRGHRVICRNASPPRGIRGLRARGIRGLGPPLPQGFVATFKSLVTFVSGKTFVPLFLCVFFD